jgi:hypothetical protein
VTFSANLQPQVTVRVLVRIVLWTWFIVALVAGRLELLARLPAAVTPGVLVALTVLVLAACFGLPAVRAWWQALEVRALVLLHVSRFVGGYFLFLYHRGALPYAFAVPGAWGEMIVALLALLVVLVPMRAGFRRHACLIWNTFGSVDILLVVATAARIGFSHPWQLRALQVLPLSILPTFLVPLLVATHVIIFVRLGRESPETTPPA